MTLQYLDPDQRWKMNYQPLEMADQGPTVNLPEGRNDLYALSKKLLSFGMVSD